MMSIPVRLLIISLALLPAAGHAQLANRPDSSGLAWAIAKAIHPPLERNGAPRAIIVTGTTLTAVSKAWNPRLTRALKDVDSAIFARKVTKETMRINISGAEMTLDSATVTVALSRCFADRFVGTSGVYVFKRTGGDWAVVSEQKGISARGACPKAYGQP